MSSNFNSFKIQNDLIGVGVDCEFDPVEVEVCTDVCCCCCYFTVAKLSINNKFYHYTVLFKREENNVSDSLSWGTTTDEAKSLLLLTFCTLVFSTRCQNIQNCSAWSNYRKDTIEDQDITWRQWEEYCKSIKIKSDFWSHLGKMSCLPRLPGKNWQNQAPREGWFPSRLMKPWLS